MFTKEQGEGEFRIVGPDSEEGATVGYGEIATLKIGPAIYYAESEDDADDSPVMCVQSIRPMPTNCEAVEFEEPEEGAPVVISTEEAGAAPELVE